MQKNKYIGSYKAWRALGAVSTASLAIVASQAVAQYAPISLESVANNGSSSDITARVIGGQEVEEGTRPWIGSVQSFNGSAWEHICGATLIHSDWMLTSARCINWAEENFVKDDLRIWVGGHDLTVERDGEVRAIKGTIVHESFRSNALSNDLALIQLGESVDDIEPVLIANSVVMSVVRDQQRLRLSGWGARDTEDSEYSDVLNEVFLKMQTNYMCEMSHGFSWGFVGSSLICAEVIGEKKGACLGDFGAPLWGTVPDGSAVQVGLFNWNRFQEGCNPTKNGYDVFARVASHRRWIENNAKITLPEPSLDKPSSPELGSNVCWQAPKQRNIISSQEYHFEKWLTIEEAEGGPLEWIFNSRGVEIDVGEGVKG